MIDASGYSYDVRKDVQLTHTEPHVEVKEVICHLGRQDERAV